MKSIIEVYKIGYGPNTDLHCMPYVACKEIKKMILNDFKKIDSIEICLYNEFAKYYHNDCKFKRVMIDGFKELKVPVRIKAVKITPPAVRALYTFDVNINLMKKTQTITHRVIGTGGGNYIITDIAKKPKYPFQNFAEMEKYFLTHKNISFLKYVNSFEKNDIKLSFENDIVDTSIDIDHIFDEFYTSDISRTKGNTGLGLAIAKEFTEMLGGTISAKKIKNKLVINITFNK